MRHDYINSLREDVRGFNTDTSSFLSKVKTFKAHLVSTRDKINSEIERIEKLEMGLGQIAAEAGPALRHQQGESQSGTSEAMKKVDSDLEEDIGKVLKTA